MTEPKAYSESYEECINYVLTNYQPMIQRKSGANIMDVGCGPGDVTVDILLPSLSPDYKQLIGADISPEIVKQAREKYGKKSVEFTVLDIEADTIPIELQGRYDIIFSFFCLQRVINQRQGFANLNKLLKTGGEMLLCFIADDPFCHCYNALYQTAKWKKHMKDFDKCVNPYLHVDDPEKKLCEILEFSGFTTKTCKIIDWSFPHTNKDSVKKVLMTVEPMVMNMSDNLRDDFMDDILQALANKYGHRTEKGTITEFHKLFVVVAEKKVN